MKHAALTFAPFLIKCNLNGTQITGYFTGIHRCSGRIDFSLILWADTSSDDTHAAISQTVCSFYNVIQVSGVGDSGGGNTLVSFQSWVFCPFK